MPSASPNTPSPIKFSIIIPARDEEKYIGACLDSIEAAAKDFPGQVEVIVAINRCTDRTEEIARSRGAIIVHCDEKNLAKIRNTAAKHARGEIIVTIDADSTMTDNMLYEIDRKLSSGKYIGGGTVLRLDRTSLGIVISFMLFVPVIFMLGILAGLFWLYREDFEAIGGFDESYFSGEDIAFAKRLKAYGKTKGKRFGIISKAHIVTSSRKFDTFGDWFIITHPILVYKAFTGRHREIADEIWYDTKR